MMQIRIGYELFYECPQPTPMILTVHVDFTRASDIVFPDHLATDPAVPVAAYRDSFGNCMNIPARYCTGYLGDNGIPPPYGPMDFAGWLEVHLGGAWHTFGRVLIARGRDAADVAICSTFGPAELRSFAVITEEIPISATQF